MTEAEWLACEDPTPMLDFVRDSATDRRVRLFGVACCRRIWTLMPNRQCKMAVDRAESYSEGQCTRDRLRAASEKVKVGTLALRDECAEYAANAAWVSSQDNVKRTAEAAAVAHGVKISIDEWAVEKRTEETQQAVLFRDIFGNPFRPVAIAPTWLTPDVLALARGIYDDRAFDQLPILADALQDAGCDNDDILSHLRGPGPHVRGCWPLDLVLGLS